MLGKTLEDKLFFCFFSLRMFFEVVINCNENFAKCLTRFYFKQSLFWAAMRVGEKEPKIPDTGKVRGWGGVALVKAVCPRSVSLENSCCLQSDMYATFGAWPCLFVCLFVAFFFCFLLNFMTIFRKPVSEINIKTLEILKL